MPVWGIVVMVVLGVVALVAIVVAVVLAHRMMKQAKANQASGYNGMVNTNA